jgi:N,N'-diacetyllegionaminate synthase
MKKKTFIIAEIGPNHNGSIRTALKMVDQLSRSGVDSIKFQLGDPNKLYSANSFMADYQKKNSNKKSIIEMATSYQLSHKDHLRIFNHCKKKKIIYSCTAFDLDSLKFLDKVIKIPFFKIASGEVFSLDMLDYISKQNKPIFLSTGMSTFSDIKLILKKLNKFKKKDITIMHCVSSYPAIKENLNLNIIDEIKRRYKCKIGYSDHSVGDDACLIAVAKGAKVIEKHVTISKNLNGPDHKSSATISEFKKLVKKIRNFELLLGNGVKKFSKNEIHIQKVAKKSIVAKFKIFKNQIIKKKDICFKRPGTGISPIDIQTVIGKKAMKDIEANTIIRKKLLS